MKQIKVMDCCVRLGANRSDSWPIARICNDVWRNKTRFYVSFFMGFSTNLLSKFLILLLLPLVLHAKEAAPTSDNPALEARMMQLAEGLRCLVCQNQTIADSHAALAVDLRDQIREMMQKGQNDQQILDYMTARYGDFILYRPPVKQVTALLWFGPVLLLFGGLLALLVTLIRRRRMSEDGPDPDDSLATEQGEQP